MLERLGPGFNSRSGSFCSMFVTVYNEPYRYNRSNPVHGNPSVFGEFLRSSIDILLSLLFFTDRILDMGFKKELDVIDNLPKGRQTLLFSKRDTIIIHLLYRHSQSMYTMTS
ncbi:hypothetical protein PROFUN_06383 [Planoprotostelium fungivorum]|uniref:Uncharacterized protein n=1 Tax=Planoprotostelium fungivorum TaxID=1890364 RepID=A0A2P6NNR6_9EUKA|nr:hypothetical protein PROFUN_06383 [Planoprotostelium fungivorum]